MAFSSIVLKKRISLVGYEFNGEKSHGDGISVCVAGDDLTILPPVMVSLISVSFLIMEI